MRFLFAVPDFTSQRRKATVSCCAHCVVVRCVSKCRSCAAQQGYGGPPFNQYPPGSKEYKKAQKEYKKHAKKDQKHYKKHYKK